MPTFAEQQTQAAALIQSQIENSEYPLETLPYWEAYNAVVGARDPGSPPASTTLQLIDEDLTADTTIEAGYAYIYLDVIIGPVTINGLTWETGYVLNREPVHGARYPAVSLQIPSGSKIRLVGAK